MVNKVFVGLIILLFSVALFVGSNQILYYFVDNPYTFREINIAENIGNGTSIYNLDFNFSKEVIFSNYDISNGERLYTSYLNVYIDQFIDNSSIEEITSFKLNDNLYIPQNKSYEYKIQIEDETLTDNDIQTLIIEKSNNLVINKISLNYRGIDYANFDYYTFVIRMITVVLFFIGIGILWSS